VADGGKVTLEICAPEREPVKFEVDKVIVPGADGVFSVLPGHTPILSTLTVGVLIAEGPFEQRRFFAVSGGFARVADDHVLILSKTVEHEEEIELERARSALDRAERRLRKADEDVDAARAEGAVTRAFARINAHSREEY